VIVAVGYLHDTLEDTDTNYVDLGRRFGSMIADLVLEVTDVSRPNIGNRAVRKAVDRQYLAGASWQGDMLSNTKDIVAHDLGFAQVYVPEKKLLIDQLTKVRNVSYPIWRAAYDSIVQAEQVVLAAA
jgi:(p)ppGpp synthase/HD superfamily hydrolase